MLFRTVLTFASAAVTIAVAAPASAQAVDGAKLFASKCGICHANPADAAQPPKMGPSLKGVVGRKAASAPNFTRYSPAMKAFGKPWTRPLLDGYLTKPQAVVKGTTMAFPGMPNPAERKAVIDHLAKFK